MRWSVRQIAMQTAQVIAMLVLTSNAGQDAHAASFQGLGVPGDCQGTGAAGVAARGDVVVGTMAHLNGIDEAFRWTADTGIVGLGAGYDFVTHGSDVSSDGSTAVGWHSTIMGRDVAFRWTKDGGMASLPGSLAADHYAQAVSADGAVVVGFRRDGSGTTALRWEGGKVMELEDLGGWGSGTEAYGVSADGLAIVGNGRTNSRSPEAFLWTPASGTIGLGDLAGGYFGSWASDISSDGAVVVGASSSASGEQAYRWTSRAGMMGLRLPPGAVRSYATGVSADGWRIVGYGHSLSEPEPFLWDRVHGTRNLAKVLAGEYGLDLAGWNLETAEAISDDGRTIVGNGLNPKGQPEAWLARIPEFILPVIGDVDLDADVDTFDVAVIQTKYSMTREASWADGDFDGNGAVDIFAVALMQVHYGHGVADFMAPVPEPAALVLAAVGFAAVLACRAARFVSSRSSTWRTPCDWPSCS
ncbi:MAG: hypothetical protein ACYC0Y_26010 [Pirellulales bacterium]